MRRLENLVAVVTGAGRGIGEACARRFANEGAIVAVAGHDLAGAVAVADSIVAGGGRASAHGVDLASETEIVALFRNVMERHGRLDVLLNNAADTHPDHLALDQTVIDLEVAVWDHAFAVNARGTMLMIKHAIPHMIAGRGGSIINTGSGSAIAGDTHNTAYAASKGAINTLTRHVATQFGKQGIRCNTVLPGLIMTEMAISCLSVEQQATIARQTLTPELGSPDDIAGAVAFLASGDARFVTGQMLCVDGGVTVHMPHAVEMSELVASMKRDQPAAH